MAEPASKRTPKNAITAAIGPKIRDARHDAQLSQERFAQLLGVTRDTIGKWESGETAPDLDLAVSICALTGAQIWDLVPDPRLFTARLEEPLGKALGVVARGAKPRTSRRSSAASRSSKLRGSGAYLSDETPLPALPVAA